MYCPVDGMEYRQGITRCPEHDVALVDEAPYPEEDERPLLGWMQSEAAARIAFLIVVAAGAVYAVTSIVLYAYLTLGAERDWSTLPASEIAQFVNAAARGVGIGAFGALAAGVLVRAYSRLRTTDGPRAADDSPDPGPGWVMPLLFWVTVVSSAVWVTTGVATSREETRYRFQGGAIGFVGGAPSEPPSESFLDLYALHSAAYTVALSSLALMGAETMRRAHTRLRGPHQ